jgi:uncharacterized coiled-coil protein SlyX
MAEPSLEFIGGKLQDIQVEQRLQRMRFDIVEQRFSTLDARLGGLEERAASIEGKLDGIEERVASIDGKLDDIQSMLDVIIDKLK